MTAEERAVAQVANWVETLVSPDIYQYIIERATQAIKDAINQETEACAKIADEFSTKGISDYAIKTRIAKAIRLRTQNSTQDKRGGK